VVPRGYHQGYRAEVDRWVVLEATSSERGNLPMGLDDDSPYSQFTEAPGRGVLVCFNTDALAEATDRRMLVAGRQTATAP
jgi:hypothetical protein